MVRGSGAVLQPLSSSLYSASCRTGQAVPLGATLATMCLFKVEKEEAEALMTMVFPTQSQLFCKLNMEIKLFFPVCVCVCVCVYILFVFSWNFLFGKKFWKAIVSKVGKLFLKNGSPKFLVYKCLDVWSFYSASIFSDAFIEYNMICYDAAVCQNRTDFFSY
jgi:hypothetical protein